jgi:hypothetical protein
LHDGVPLQNRVTPYGTLTASRSRAATLFGNRGCLHDDAGRIVRWAVGPRWIACQLSFKGRGRRTGAPHRRRRPVLDRRRLR